MSGPGTNTDLELAPRVTIDDATLHQVRTRKDDESIPPSPTSTIEDGDIATIQEDDDEPDWPTEWGAWLALIGCFFLMFNSWGLVNAFGTFATEYKESLLLTYDLKMFNLIGSTESFVVLVSSFFVGRLLDAGYSRIILPTGFVLTTLGMFMLSLAANDRPVTTSSYGLIWLTQGLVVGLGMACFFVPSSQSTYSFHSTSGQILTVTTVVATWFPKRRSWAIGVVASGASIGKLQTASLFGYFLTKLTAGLVYPFMVRRRSAVREPAYQLRDLH